MLRIAIGVLGILLIGLGFSSESTLSWFKQKVTAPFSATPSLSIGNPVSLQTTSLTTGVSNDVSTIETLSSTSAPQSESVNVMDSGEGLLVAAAEGVSESTPQPVAVEDDAPRIEIVPAVAETTEATEGNAIDAVMKKAAAANDDTLFVLKDKVNMREGPSIQHTIVLQLEKGQELMEFKRDGKWVHVGAYGTEGTVGWVHRTLVGDAP